MLASFPALGDASFVRTSRLLIRLWDTYRGCDGVDEVIEILSDVYDQVSQNFERGLFANLVGCANYLVGQPAYRAKVEALPLYDSPVLEALFRQDPSDADIIFALAKQKIRQGEKERGMHLLKRLARSEFKLKRLALNEIHIQKEGDSDFYRREYVCSVTGSPWKRNCRSN